MRSLVTVTILLAAMAVSAQAAKSCEELKDEISKKIEAKGAKSYLLEIVPTEKNKDSEGKVVGSCDGGTKKIVYSRTATATTTSAAASTPAKPKKP